MIKRLFLPEKIGNRRILSQRILGITAHDDRVSMAIIHAKHHKTIIETLVQEQIADGSIETYPERTTAALKKIITHAKSFDYIRISVPSSIVVFKELQLQFTDPEKIRMVLDFEIESMLPFSTNDAIVDFIITKVDKIDKTQQTAHILVAAVRSNDLQEYLTMYTQAGIDPMNITIDLFALYGLYQQIPAYYALPKATALVELGMQSTRIVFIQDGQLRLTRLLPRGIDSVVSAISTEANVSATDIEHRLATLGVHGGGDEALARIIQKHMVLLLHDIQFTLNSFSLKLNFYDELSTILFTGVVHRIKDLLTFSGDTLQIPCEEFDCHKILESKLIKNKVKDPNIRWNDYLLALGTALPAPQQGDFDLRRKQFAFHRQELLVKQIIVAIALITIVIGTIGIKGYMDIGTLNQRAEMLEATEVNRFRNEKVFPKNKFPTKPTLKNVIRDAEKIVREKRELFAPLAKLRMRPLDVLLELTSLVNRKQFDITVKDVTISTQQTGEAKIELEGLFKSKTGDHFSEYPQIINRFKESHLLKFVDQNETVAPEGGVSFTVKFKLKET
jgi:type IV pilus assembly protein PilM